MDWYIKVLKKYAEFNGRAQRAEYWYFALFNVLISIALTLPETLINNTQFLANIYSLAVLVPGIAVTVRRLHDINKSGWYLLVALIPCVGAIILLIWTIQDSDPGPNEYGENPKMLTLE